jgi:hypothetical protein
MGDIVYKTLIRIGISILLLWFFKDHFDEKYFWIISVLAIYFFTVHPAYLSYKKFTETNQKVLAGTLCSQCKHFDQTAVICLKYDKHPTENFIPCEGNDWEPK